MRRTRLRSTLATGRSLSRERRTRFDFLRRRWPRRCFRRRNFPLPVILKRFAVALCVFILGIMVILPSCEYASKLFSVKSTYLKHLSCITSTRLTMQLQSL